MSGSLEDGLRQLLAMSGSEQQAALAALSPDRPPPGRQGGALGPSPEPSAWSGGSRPAGPAAGPGRWPPESGGGLQQAPMKVPLLADRGGGFVPQEPRGAPRALPLQHGEDDCSQLVQSITNAMSRVFLDASAPGQAGAGSAAVREQRVRHIEWLRGQLELQQEQSMRKISHIFDHRAPGGRPPAAPAGPRRGPHAAQGQPPAGSRGRRPQEADAGSTLHQLRSQALRCAASQKQILPVPVHAMPGWDPRLALAAAEAAGSVPSHWAPADAEGPPRAAWPKKQAQASRRGVSAEESATQQARMASETLRHHLRALQEVDSRRVVQVRKISKLGFQSGAALESHYSAFGTVECVRVAFSHVKPQSTGLAVRIRPSGLGFVVMSSIEEAEAILRAGENQVVSGVEVLVRPYEVRAASEKDPTGNDDHENDLLAGA